MVLPIYGGIASQAKHLSLCRSRRGAALLRPPAICGGVTSGSQQYHIMSAWRFTATSRVKYLVMPPP